jgi:SAM-dependent methyltransferase
MDRLLVNDTASTRNTASIDGVASGNGSYDRSFWLGESSKFARPHFRLEKAARVINALAGDRECSLLDIGCGPSTLRQLLRPNIRYFGIDMAIPVPAANLRELNILDQPIAFDDRQFDLVTAQGVFEYLSDQQARKLAEIARLLAPQGTFITTYTNFGHRRTSIYEAFNNVQTLTAFRKSLERHFYVDKSYPISHNWQHGQPVRPLVRAINSKVNVNIPLVSPALAVEYLYICSSRRDRHQSTTSPTPRSALP